MVAVVVERSHRARSIRWMFVAKRKFDLHACMHARTHEEMDVNTQKKTIIQADSDTCSYLSFFQFVANVFVVCAESSVYKEVFRVSNSIRDEAESQVWRYCHEAERKEHYNQARSYPPL